MEIKSLQQYELWKEYLALLVLMHPLQCETQTAQTQAVLSYGWLTTERTEFCKTLPIPPPQLDEKSDYAPVETTSQEGHSSRLMAQRWRGASMIQPVVRACPFVKSTPQESKACAQAQSSYASSLILLATPLLLALAFLLTWKICCWVACCRCCRRCCLCAERKAGREARTWQRLAVGFFVFFCTIFICSCALAAYTRSVQISDGIANMLCSMLTMADETLNGSPQFPIFLGVDVGIHRIEMLRRLLDVDGTAMTDVRSILDQTANFAAAMEDLLKKLDHMQRLLTLTGQRKTKEHTCVFCHLAVGNNATSQGLLVELRREVQASSAEAMRSIITETSSNLRGRKLVEVSSQVQRGVLSLQVFKQAYVGTFVGNVIQHKDAVRTAEDLRHTLFQVTSAFCIIHALVMSTLAIWLARRSNAKYPSSTPSCLTWFCAFCSLSFAVLFAGIMVLVAVPVSEICNFWRYELLSYNGVSDYYKQLGLYDLQNQARKIDPLAVDVFRTCLTPNGTGDIMQALSMKNSLEFQKVLDTKFVELEDKLAGRVVDTAKFELLVSRAEAFGGLFVLDPDNPLPLEPTVAPKMIGSSLDADDQEGPDGESIVYGLNTYAQLIAGPGQYSFEHGTSGGGTLITATTPTESQLRNVPLQMQHAIIYARLKEQLLTEPNIFRCDIMDSSYKVTERACNFADYKKSVAQWARDVKAAGLNLGDKAQQAKPLIATSLKNSLAGILAK